MDLNDLYAVQAEREQQSKQAGITRYREQATAAEQAGAAASTFPAVKLQKALLEPGAEAVQRLIDELAKSNRSIYKSRVLAGIGAHHAAYLTLQVILGHLGERLGKLVHPLAKTIEDNLNLALAMKTEAVGPLLSYLIKEKYKGSTGNFKAIGLEKARRKKLDLPTAKAIRQGSANIAQARAEEDGQLLSVALTAEERASIGQALLEAVIGAAASMTFKTPEGEEPVGGFWSIETDTEYNSKTHTWEKVQTIQPTLNWKRYREEGHALVEAIRPQFETMVVPPCPWTGPNDGGYLSARLPIIKAARDNFLRDLDASGKLDPLKKALNTLQATGWRYNTFVLETMEALWADQALLKCWPEQAERKLPAKPNGAEGNEASFKLEHPELWQKWKDDCSEVHHHNESKSRIARIDEIGQMLDVARAHVDKLDNTAFYEVWQADFRGRVYPVAARITSQGNDMAKSLMEFSEGKPVDEEGAYWLALEVANSWANNKIDKALLEKRVEWVETNKDRIFQAGTDPLADLWWAAADGGRKPWAFLAACKEYAGWLAHGVGYVSHGVCRVDGSCNGLQHYSALLRSDADGALVNLVNNGAPSDIYAVVAAVADRLLSESTDAFAARFVGQITRGVAKRPCMTYAYSVSYSGIKEQIAHEPDAQHLWAPFDAVKDREGKRKAISMIASVLLAAIKEVVSSAAHGMAFLQMLAQEAGAKAMPVVWATPDGFEVMQDYRKFEMRQVRTILSGALKIRKDKVALVQEDMKATLGLTLEYDPVCLAGLTGTAKRDAVRQAKAFIKGANILRLYRTQVEELLQQWDGAEFNFAAFFEERYRAAGLVPVEELRPVVEECATMVLVNVMTERHLREETTEEVDQETGEITKKRSSVYVGEPTDEIDVQRQTRGIGPNVVHSLDGCHMRMTLNAAVDEGISSFAMVHDSYGSHAADMQRLSVILREQFVKCHEGRYLESLARSLAENGYVEVDAAEEAIKGLKYGSLDLNGVLNSPYFFA